MRLLCITASVGRSRSVKNAADTKLFAAPGLAKSKYRRFSRPTSTAMHKRRSKNQVGLNSNRISSCLLIALHRNHRHQPLTCSHCSSSLLIPLQSADLPCLSLCSLQSFPAYPSATCSPPLLIPLQPADLPCLQAKYIFEYLLRKKNNCTFSFPML